MTNKNQHSNKKLAQKLNQISKKLGYELDKIIIYGSRAKNTHQPDSDLDVITISKDYQGKDFNTVGGEYLWEWGENLPKLDITPLTPKQYKKAKQEDWLVEEATKTGKTIKP